MMTKTDKIRAALERACIWDVEGAPYYREALSELDGCVIVPIEMTDEQAEAVSMAINVCGGIAESAHHAMIAPYVSPSEQAVNGEKK